MDRFSTVADRPIAALAEDGCRPQAGIHSGDSQPGSSPDAAWAAESARLHDYLYWEQYLPRDTVDEIFKFVIEDFNVEAVTAQAIYGAVRGLGQLAWNDNPSSRAPVNGVC